MLVTMDLERSWYDLVAALDDWTAATVVTADTIEVALPAGDGPGRRVLVMVTPDEWDGMTGVMWGSFENAVEDVKHLAGDGRKRRIRRLQLVPPGALDVPDLGRRRPSGGAAGPRRVGRPRLRGTGREQVR
jgi:hypothetical protein